MKFYTCEKCGKIFDHKHNYIYHTTKLKISCSNIPNKVKEIQLPIIITPAIRYFHLTRKKTTVSIVINHSIQPRIQLDMKVIL